MDQAGVLRQLVNRKAKVGSRSRAIAVTSGKGGVGKTSLSVNLSVALARQGLRVGILDGDLGLGNVDIVLGLVPSQTLSDVLFGDKRLSDIFLSGPEGITVMAGGSGVYELANVSEWRLQRFVLEIAHLDRLFDLLVIDTGAGMSRHVLSFLLSCDEIIVVTTSELTSITDAYGMIKLIATRNPAAIIRVIVNKVANEAAARRVLQSLEMVANQFVENPVRLDLLGYVPFDAAVSHAIHNQVPFILGSPQARASQAIQKIADRLIEGERVKQPTGIGRLFRRMVQMIQGETKG